MRLSKTRLFNAKTFQDQLDGCGNPIEVFKQTLKLARSYLEQQHIAGTPAQEIVAHHSWLIDEILGFAWRIFLPKLAYKKKIALVAVGGYGRGELHPGSDIDLMLLIESNRYERVKEFNEQLLRFLWDIGLEVGHSIRSIKDCVLESRKDLTVVTNLMEARVLEGDAELVDNMFSSIHPSKIWPSAKFFAAKLQEQTERHLKFDDTAYNLEPNLKDGPGGLRDLQMIGWVAQRHFGGNTLGDLVDRGFLTEEEFKALIRCRNFLWKLRNGLHFLANRREDRLLFDYQRTLAQQFGYRDSEARLGVEQMMKRYYRTVKDLRLLNEILLQHFQEAIISKSTKTVTPINRRFQSIDGFVDTVDEGVFNRHPFALLEIFLVLQQEPDLKGVRASTIKQIRANLHRIDQNFREDIVCRSLFMEILRQPHGVTHELRRMGSYGVLGAYIPAFGRVVGQMQHDLFHVYTVDAHSLFVIRNLRRFALDRFSHEFPEANKIMARVVKPERLYLAGLFHDIAKGRGGDHSSLGQKDAFQFCKQHDLSDYDAHFVAWMVRHHLLMSWTAQREDVSDPEVVLKFAQTVGDREHLENLYLLTMADIRATSPHVWNAWKAQLLADLRILTTRALRHGFGKPIQLEDRIRDLKRDAIKLLDTIPISNEQIEQHWNTLDDEYFLRHDAETIAWHAEHIIPTAAMELPLVVGRHQPQYGGNQILFLASESETLLANVAGGLESLQLNIVDARIHRTRSGLAMYVFIVLGKDNIEIGSRENIAKQETYLRTQILDPKNIRDPRNIATSRTLKHFPIITNVDFSSSLNGQSTIMEVIAQDRPGLLYNVALALLDCKVRLISARIATFGERAEDVFMITDRDNNPVTDSAQQECLNQRIHKALDSSSKDEKQNRQPEAVAV